MTRIICLHGYTQNDEIFKKKLARILSGYECIYPLGPYNVAPFSPDIVSRGWWHLESKEAASMPHEYCNVDRSLDIIDNVFQPNDILLGFSQGAVCAMIYAAKRRTPSKLILFAPTDIMDSDWYPEKPIDIPTCIIYGKRDIFCSNMNFVENMFTNAKIHIHDQGHVIPSNSTIKQLIQKFTEQESNTNLNLFSKPEFIQELDNVLSMAHMDNSMIDEITFIFDKSFNRCNGIIFEKRNKEYYISDVDNLTWWTWEFDKIGGTVNTWSNKVERSPISMTPLECLDSLLNKRSPLAIRVLDELKSKSNLSHDQMKMLSRFPSNSDIQEFIKASEIRWQTIPAIASEMTQEQSIDLDIVRYIIYHRLNNNDRLFWHKRFPRDDDFDYF